MGAFRPTLPRMTMPPEFDRIARYFRPLAGPGGLDLLDDAALIDPPAGRQIVIAADAMVEGVHFLPDDPPDLVARKLLRTNLSDLAAMGAEPLGYLTTISVRRDTPEAWFAAFSAGLAADQQQFGLNLLGGDCTSTPGPVSLSLTILGHVAPGQAVRRIGARPGDEIWVSGTIGDGALGLMAASGEIDDPDGFLADRYRLPQPRLGLARPDLVRACLDVSDGLVQDLGHLCRAGQVGAQVFAPALPRSKAAQRFGDEVLGLCLTGGDDYELLMAVGPRDAPALATHARALGIKVSRIGMFTQGAPVVRVLDARGATMALPRGGWSHF